MAESPTPEDQENNTADAPPERAAPLDYDKPDMGCFVGLIMLLAAVFLFPIVVIRFGGPAILFIVGGFLLAVITPIMNPLEKAASEKTRWISRICIWLLLCGLCTWGLMKVFQEKDAPQINQNSED